jgi:hypothetical protein
MTDKQFIYSEFGEFKLNPTQEKILEAVKENPNIRLQLSNGQPSYEMVKLAEYLSGKGKSGLRADKIIFDEYVND